MTFALFSLWTFVLIGRPQDLIVSLVPFRPALVLAALTVAVVLVGSGRTFFESPWRAPEGRKYVVLFAVMIAGIPFAYHRRVAFDFIFLYYLMNVLYFAVFVTLVDSLEKLKKILWIIALCALFYGVSGLLQGTFSDGRFTIYGTMFDPNDIAYVLVTLIPLCLYFVVRSEGRIKKVLALTAVATSLTVIFLTASRTGLLGLFVILTLALFTQMGSMRVRYKFGLILVTVLIVALNFERLNIQRYLTLADIGSDYNVTEETGRLEVWRKGYELFLANPITGVGVRCFPMAIGYLREKQNVLPVWQATHNSYLQVAVETGIPGLILFLWLIVGCLRNFLRCRTIEPTGALDADGEQFRTVSGLMQLAFVGHLVSAFFLSQGYSLLFTLFFAMSAVMRQLVVTTAGVERPRLNPADPFCQDLTKVWSIR